MEENYITMQAYFRIVECHFKQTDGIVADVDNAYKNKIRKAHAGGNGRLDAVSNAIKQCFGISYELSVYEEHLAVAVNKIPDISFQKNLLTKQTDCV